MKKRILAVCLLLVVLLTACRPADLCLGKAEWGMSRDALKAAYGDRIKSGSDERVLNLIKANDFYHGRTATVGYVFTDDKLTNITAQIFLDENEKTKDAIAALTEELKQSFGAPEDTKGVQNSVTFSKGNTQVQLMELAGCDNFVVAVYTPAGAKE